MKIEFEKYSETTDPPSQTRALQRKPKNNMTFLQSTTSATHVGALTTQIQEKQNEN